MVCTDISDVMIQKLQERFNESDFSESTCNKTMINDQELPVGFEIPNINSFSRMVIAGIANNEALPFKDGQFDCYIANLSLMLVDNYKNMLTEALRVC